MSVLSAIQIYSHQNPLGGKIWNPAIRWTNKFSVFVVLIDEEGKSGGGECWCFDSAPDTLVSYIRTEVAPHFLGTEFSEFEEISEKLVRRATLTARHGILASALSGFDIAFWDYESGNEALPLWKYLNPEGTGTVSLYASGGLYGLNKGEAELKQEVASMVQDGFSLVKIKVGAASKIDDLNRVIAALEALPEQGQLIVDGVYSFSPDDALSFYHSLPTERIAAFQSPVAANDLEGMKWLTGKNVPVMATEAEYRSEIHQILVAEECVQYLQTAPIACGGISRVRQLCDLIAGSSVKLSLEVSSTGFALNVAQQLAAAYQQIEHVEYHYVHQVFFDQINLQPHESRPNRFRLPEQAGVGFDLPFEELTLEAELNAADHRVHSTKTPRSEAQSQVN